MSVRLVVNRIAKHGRLYFQTQCKVKQIHTKIIETTKNQILPRSPRVTVAQVVRKSFFDNVLSSSAFVSELRKKAIKTVIGRGGPFFAFVGVGVAGNGFLSKEDELEGVCGEIREVASKIQSSWNYEEITRCLHRDITLDDLEVGPSIGKGCSAVVYGAALKSEYFEAEQMESEIEDYKNVPSIHNIGRFIHSSGGSASTFPLEVTESSDSTEEISTEVREMNDHQQEKKYPLAMKMMFNYDIQSNAMSIIRAMSKETIPARSRKVSGNGQLVELLRKEVLQLPIHPNIVCMFGFFCAPVGDFHDGALLYPSAQPPRINPQGYGRNMSLYLVMKRYDTCLKDLLKNYDSPLSPRNRMLLFTQLLEAIVHLNRYGIAHRDLKTDNILIDLHENDSCPELVLTDFGCALANKSHGLRIPYVTADTDKGGNTALMAPEIYNKEPGRFAILDYTKADLWASGAIAYEIFGLNNPFYSDEENSISKNYNNVEGLPNLDGKCPALVKELVLNILDPNPNERVRPEIAANIMQLFLWAPSRWLKASGEPGSHELIEWLLSLTYKLVCDNTEKNCYVDYILINNFLSRARLNDIRTALNWIVANN